MEKELEIKQVVEALIFTSEEPLPLHKIQKVTDTIHPLTRKELLEIIASLRQEYTEQKRGFMLEEIAEGFLFRTCQEVAPYLELFYQNKKPDKLSQASVEVLAIVAYRQPITRPQIEAIRGVDCSGILQNLTERELIETAGKLEVPGRPSLYKTTKTFLKHFGLQNLGELPPINPGKQS